MDYFLFNFSGVQFHYTMSQINILKDLKHPEDTYTSVAERYHVSKATVLRLFDKHVDIMRKPLPMVLSIDEHYFPESDMDSLYCFLLMNFITGEVIDVLPTRRKHSPCSSARIFWSVWKAELKS